MATMRHSPQQCAERQGTAELAIDDHLSAPAAYAPLPFAFAHLGWPAGIIFLGLAGCVTWYTSLLLASLDRHDGHRHVRYCDLAGSIYGKLHCLVLALNWPVNPGTLP